MKIVTYDELKDPNAFLQLMESAFWWLVTPERVAEIRKLDPRCRDNYGFGLLQGRNLIGFVGVMDIPVRTWDGKTETAVGIHHVATHPGFSRQGIATRLLEHVHELCRKRGYRFSFLFTSRSLVAWSLYRRLGYKDVPSMGRYAPRAELILPKRKGPRGHDPNLSSDSGSCPRTQKNVTRPEDFLRAERIAEQAMRNCAGFAVREPGWLKTRLKVWGLNRSGIFVDQAGYAFTEPQKDGVWITEFFARNRAAYERLLARIRALGKRVIVDCMVYDPVLRSIYRRQGFRFRYVNYGTLMAKPLTQVSVQAAFGPHFFWTPVDQF